MGILDTDQRILALGIARMMDSIGNSFLIVVLPLYITSGVVTGGALGLAPALITGIILSAYGFFNSAIQPFAGNLSDRVGKRRVFVVTGLLLLMVSNFAYSLVNSYELVLLVRVGQGLGAAFTIPATIALVNELSTATARGESMGVFNTFRMVGFGLGPVVAGSVVSGGPYTVFGLAVTGFEAAFYIASFGALLAVVVVVLLVSDPQSDPQPGDGTEAGNNLEIAVFDHAGDKTLDPVFTLGLATLFMAIGIALLASLETQINAALEQSAQLFGYEFAAFTLAQVLFQTPIGRWSDRYGRRPFILAGLLVLVPATLIEGLVTTPLQLGVARFVQGLAGAAVFAPAMALAGDIAHGRSSGTTLSVLTMAFGLGVAIGPLSAGYLSGIELPFGQPYVTPFVFGAALALLGFGLVYTQVEETESTAGTGSANVGPSSGD